MAKKKIYRAGVVPYFVKDDEIYMMFMRPSDPKFGGGKYQVAKGKYEEGENAEQAGFREAGEELGLFAGNVIQSFEAGVFMGRTTVFAAEIRDQNAFGNTTDETESTIWMTLEQFLENGRDLHKPVVKSVHRQIMKKI